MKTLKFMINFWSKVEYLWTILIIYYIIRPPPKHGKWAGRGKSGWVLGWVGSGQVYMCFSYDFFFFFKFYKENNMYLPFGNSCHKLLDIKYITLNSPLISRMNSIKLINTYSIILKLYKSQHCLTKTK